MKDKRQISQFLRYLETGAIEEMREMIRKGFSPSDTELSGENSALIFAADASNKEMVELLVNAGADVNYASDTGETPLSAACFACVIGDRPRFSATLRLSN